MFFLDIGHLIGKLLSLPNHSQAMYHEIRIDMKRTFVISLLMLLLSAPLSAQALKGYYYNEEYQLYLRINADKQNITVPGQDIYGELAGYFGSRRDGRLWLITEMERTDSNKVVVTVINDYGSEDFTATLREDDQQVITMKHLKGSTFKIVVDSKYVKIPKEIKLKKLE